MSAAGRRLALALVHHPVLDKQGAVVTSAITNIDVHDLARSARTYGCTELFLVHPVDAQRELVSRIKEHWETGSSAARIPARKDALALVQAVPTLADAFAALGGRDVVEVWTTAARSLAGARSLEMQDARVRLESDDPRAVLLVFGTGWGLTSSIIDDSDALLPPIHARVPSGYNHLSVRAACAILLDRLRG